AQLHRTCSVSGVKRHAVACCKCLLLTQSGHGLGLSHVGLSRYDALSCGSGKLMRRRDTTRGKSEKAQRSKALKRRKTPTSVSSRKRLMRSPRERSEAVEQLAATTAVLRIISKFPGSLAPVFEAILENCVGLCGGDRAVIWQFNGHALRLVGGKNTTPEVLTFLRQ